MPEYKKIEKLLENLKSCPFCGGSPEIVTDDNFHYVRCRVCYTFNGFGKVPRKNDYANEMLSALNAWDRRAS